MNNRLVTLLALALIANNAFSMRPEEIQQSRVAARKAIVQLKAGGRTNKMKEIYDNAMAEVMKLEKGSIPTKQITDELNVAYAATLRSYILEKVKPVKDLVTSISHFSSNDAWSEQLIKDNGFGPDRGSINLIVNTIDFTQRAIDYLKSLSLNKSVKQLIQPALAKLDTTVTDLSGAVAGYIATRSFAASGLLGTGQSYHEQANTQINNTQIPHKLNTLHADILRLR